MEKEPTPDQIRRHLKKEAKRLLKLLKRFYTRKRIRKMLGRKVVRNL